MRWQKWRLGQILRNAVVLNGIAAIFQARFSGQINDASDPHIQIQMIADKTQSALNASVAIAACQP
jgi:hypothetical protein